jgi:hypothetical protein
MKKASLLGAVLAAVLLLLQPSPTGVRAQLASPPDRLIDPFQSRDQVEDFLRTAKIVSARGISRGVTGPQRLTLYDGTIQHDAVYKNIDEHKLGITELEKGREVDFKDSWKYEIAAYEIDKLLGSNLVPPTVERVYRNSRGSLQYWIENCMMEGDRQKKKLEWPDKPTRDFQLMLMAAFDQLVYNIDRNLGNTLITPEWKCVLIDHSRCFKSLDYLRAPKELVTFSRRQMNAFAQLNLADLKAHCGKYLDYTEISTTLKRRDLILARYQRLLKEKGEKAVFP